MQHLTDIEVDLVSRHRDADVCHLTDFRISVKTTDCSYLGTNKLSAYSQYVCYRLHDHRDSIACTPSTLIATAYASFLLTDETAQA